MSTPIHQFTTGDDSNAAFLSFAERYAIQYQLQLLAAH